MHSSHYQLTVNRHLTTTVSHTTIFHCTWIYPIPFPTHTTSPSTVPPTRLIMPNLSSAHLDPTASLLHCTKSTFHLGQAMVHSHPPIPPTLRLDTIKPHHLPCQTPLSGEHTIVWVSHWKWTPPPTSPPKQPNTCADTHPLICAQMWHQASQWSPGNPTTSCPCCGRTNVPAASPCLPLPPPWQQPDTPIAPTPMATTCTHCQSPQSFHHLNPPLCAISIPNWLDPFHLPNALPTYPPHPTLGSTGSTTKWLDDHWSPRRAVNDQMTSHLSLGCLSTVEHQMGGL